MQQHFVISIISDDKPGVVEMLSAVVAENGGNWEDSRMAHFAGKFAGIVRLSASAQDSPRLKAALQNLAGADFKLQIEDALAVAADSRQTLQLKLVGNDRPGIVKEISRALAARKINVETLDTRYGSTPWSGEPLFSAECTISVSEDVSIDGLYDELDEIADELGVEIDCEETSSAL
ncbi:glycine cleavage system protein R [Microbulbifer agarilyticus]|uniref:glycine cleavage system protein R n=1 Tax=Microbulbifer agarilyticus TaxID=260552 RepID=UPI001CD74695|nr:ACT domain-containing protein [Microbulbifer agarilyticus]MCA0893882.1 amino acid-binding protein [Microbulbifer agarilyticus]